MPSDLERLRDMTLDELRDLWREGIARGDPPRVRQVLVRELAWAAQETERGGLDVETRRLLRSAITKAPSPTSRPRSRKSTTLRRRRSLPSGATLVRAWGGRDHEVMVLEGGNRFRYDGEEYTNLTAIARKITGARWSGPRFFGLTRKPA